MGKKQPASCLWSLGVWGHAPLGKFWCSTGKPHNVFIVPPFSLVDGHSSCLASLSSEVYDTLLI